MSSSTPLAPPTALKQEERERVIALLSDCFSRGELEIEEFEERLTVAHRTSNPSDLQKVIADLSPAEPSPQNPPMLLAKNAPDKDSTFAILGGAKRTGSWAVPHHLRVLAFWGGVELDFRDAQLPKGRVEVEITALMGGVQIIVPPTLAVEIQGSAFLGGFESMQRAPIETDPELPRLIVRGLAFMGGVDVETRLRGESSRDAHRRRHLEHRSRHRDGKG